MPEIYDSAFRTEINDCPGFILPLLNEVFGEKYSGDEKIIFHQNEHLIDRGEKTDQKRITDTNFTVCGTQKKEYHLECESSKYSSGILIRIFEYDAQIALDNSTVTGSFIRVTFPNTAVLCLRSTANTPEKMNVIIDVPGNSVSYEVPLIQLKNYTAKDIIKKKLFLLIPFYIFNFEKKLEKCNKDDEEYKNLCAEFKFISDELKRLSESEEISAYDKRKMEELSKKVIEYHAKKYEKVRKGIGDIMCGPMIETDVDVLVKKIEEKKTNESVRIMLKDNLPDEMIIRYSGISPEGLAKLKEEIRTEQT